MKNTTRYSLLYCRWFALTMDLWEEGFKKENVLGITCHFVENWALKRVILGKLMFKIYKICDDIMTVLSVRFNVFLGVFEFSYRHTSSNIEQATAEVLQLWDIRKTKIVAIVTDGAANISKSARDLVAHLINKSIVLATN